MAMTDVLDGVRDHYRAAGLTERLKTALTVLGPEDQRLGRHIRNPDYLCSPADDHARRRIRFAGASAGPAGAE
jgi:hypothetical protein